MKPQRWYSWGWGVEITAAAGEPQGESEHSSKAKAAGRVRAVQPGVNPHPLPRQRQFLRGEGKPKTHWSREEKNNELNGITQDAVGCGASWPGTVIPKRFQGIEIVSSVAMEEPELVPSHCRCSKGGFCSHSLSPRDHRSHSKPITGTLDLAQPQSLQWLLCLEIAQPLKHISLCSELFFCPSGSHGRTPRAVGCCGRGVGSPAQMIH